MKVFVIFLVFSSMLLFAIPSVFAVPIEKVPITSFNAYSTNGKQIDKIMVGNQVILTADIENMQNKTQSFVYAIWTIDQNGKRTHEDWINATLDAKSSFTQSISWMPTDAGNYTVESSVWESIEHPTAFSAVWHINLEVMPKTSDTRPPLKQSSLGIPFNEIQCKQNLVLIQKYDGSPACVTESTKQKLIERGWTGTTSITNGTNTNTKQDNWQEKILKIQSRAYCSVMDLDRIPKDQIIYQKRFGTNALMLNVNDDDLKQVPHLQEMILAMNNSTGFVPYQYQENTLVKEISSSGESQHSMIWNWLKEMFKSQYAERQDGSFSSYFEYGKYYYDISWSLC